MGASTALDKANDLLGEMDREEKLGFKAEIDGLQNKVDRIANEPALDKSLKNSAAGSKYQINDEPVKRTTS
jgi:carbonic anhydrase